jgi:hypothetical protein
MVQVSGEFSEFSTSICFMPLLFFLTLLPLVVIQVFAHFFILRG